MLDGVLHNAAGVGQVDEGSMRGKLFDLAAIVQNDRHIPHGTVKSARPDQFFTGDVEFKRESLVINTALKPAHPDLVEDQVRAGQRFLLIGAGVDLDVEILVA